MHHAPDLVPTDFLTARKSSSYLLQKHFLALSIHHDTALLLQVGTFTEPPRTMVVECLLLNQ